MRNDTPIFFLNSVYFVESEPEIPDLCTLSTLDLRHHILIIGYYCNTLQATFQRQDTSNSTAWSSTNSTL